MKRLFIKLALFVMIWAFWVSLGVNKAQAAAYLATTTTATMSSGDNLSFTVPTDCYNNLLYFTGENWYGNYLSNLEYNGVDFTWIGAGNNNGDGTYGRGYLFNAATGTHNVYMQGMYGAAVVVALFCDVDSADGSISSGGFNQFGNACGGSESISIDENDSIIIGSLGGSNTSNISGSYSTIVAGQYSNGYGTAIGYKLVNTGTQSWGMCANWVEADGGWNVFHSAPPAIYCGDDICNGTEDCGTCATDCGACVCGDGICNGTETAETCIDCLTFYDLLTAQDTYLQFNNVIEYCPINTSCVIKYKFDSSIFNYAVDYGKLYYYETSTSSPTFVKNIVPLSPRYELGDTTTGYFIASSTSTSTAFSYFSIVPCKTFGDCYGTSTVAVWYTAQVNYSGIVSDLWPATSSTSTLDFIGDFNATAYDLVCPQEKWNGDWWDKFSCGLRFGEIIIQNRASIILSGTMTKAWSAIKNMFPFNFANITRSSWELSKVSDVPSELSFLDMLDDEGNISFDFSAMTGTTTKLVFWSSDTFDNSSGVFTNIRALSKYIFYGLFLLYVYLKGKNIYNELAGNNTKDDD